MGMSIMSEPLLVLTLVLGSQSSLFASELTSISNGGLDALADVVKFMHDLRKTAESMTGPEGTV